MRAPPRLHGPSLALVAATACTHGPEPAQPAPAAKVFPWQAPAGWPLAIDSPRLIVHYQAPADLEMARTVLADVEDSWTKQITDQGASPPLDDGGRAGPDGRFDVYLDRGRDELVVEAVAPDPATPYDDYSTAMILDPWGPYGGDQLHANIFHELRHASQATDDWYEHLEFFEAEATLWETAYFGYARLPAVWADYQAHPDWTPFFDDGYRTWFMYGGALFLLYLRQHVFAGSLAFANETWHLCRNPPGAHDPDFADALEQQLAARGTSLFAELVSFARARWYAGAHANGTLESGDVLPMVATGDHARTAGAQRTTFVAAPQLLGTVYTVVHRASTDGPAARVSLASSDAAARPVVQVVGQGSADRVLDVAAGPAAVPYVDGVAVIAVTMLPANGAFDPDTVTTQTLAATVAVDR